MLTPIRSVTSFFLEFADPELLVHPAVFIVASRPTANNTAHGIAPWLETGRQVSTLFRCGSHNEIVDKTRANSTRFGIRGALLYNLDLHSNLLGGTGDIMCQRDERRFKAPLVTRRRVHVTKL